MSGFFAKERVIAHSGFNRWLVPPAALSVHLCIGEAYSFSVFKIPLSQIIGITSSAPEDWKFTTTMWIFSLAIIFLGLSAAFAGKWLEKVGPRLTMFVSACCFGGGFWISALGVYLHNIWVLYLGYGVVGGIGLGLGYVSPVSTLIKWFPDRRGMATGMAIMGFGGGAMIGAPLSVLLMDYFKSATSVGVAEAFMVMGSIYFLSMMVGALSIRIPSPDWKPEGWTPPVQENKMISKHHVHIDQALKTPQFYCLWVVLCMNVSAGIGIIAQASVMIQEIFKGSVNPAAASGYVGLLSLFNMGGRFFWSSISDFIGRKNTYLVFFLLGAALYAYLPVAGANADMIMFVLISAIIMSMYGGGFATIPAYLADIFGTRYVGGIHGRLLTAWSMAGVVGPWLMDVLRENQLNNGVPKAETYTSIMQIMVCLLLIGFVSNLLIRPVHEKHHMKHDDFDEIDGVFPRRDP
jgi:MFS family permease